MAGGRVAAALAEMRRAVATVCARARSRIGASDIMMLTTVMEGMMELRRLLATEAVNLPPFAGIDNQLALLMDAVGELEDVCRSRDGCTGPVVRLSAGRSAGISA